MERLGIRYVIVAVAAAAPDTHPGDLGVARRRTGGDGQHIDPWHAPAGLALNLSPARPAGEGS